MRLLGSQATLLVGVETGFEPEWFAPQPFPWLEYSTASGCRRRIS